MINWKVLILAYLVLRFFGTVLTVVELDGFPVLTAFVFTIGLMWVPLLVSSFVGWFVKRDSSSLLDWKAFTLTFWVLSFVGQTASLVNDGRDAFPAMGEVSAPMILSLMVAILVVWIVNRRREIKPEVKNKETEEGTGLSKSEASGIAVVEREEGWKPLPTSLKVIFVIGSFSVLTAPFSIVSIPQAGFPLLGFPIFGAGAVVLWLILNGGGTSVFLYAIWKRTNWAWKYSVAYFCFFILNGLLAFPHMREMTDSLSEAVTPEMRLAMEFTGLVTIVFANGLNVVLFALMFRKRTYFQY